MVFPRLCLVFLMKVKKEYKAEALFDLTMKF